MYMMAATVDPPAEAGVFQLFRDRLLEDVRDAVKFAGALVEEGVIASRARSHVTFAADDEQTRDLLDAVHQSLVNSSDPSRTLLSVRRAMVTSGGVTRRFNDMDRFVAGEWKIFCSLF